MSRLPRLPRYVRGAAVAAPVVAAVVSAVNAVNAAVTTDWDVAGMALWAAGWATVAAMWAYRATTHSCPPAMATAAVERGLQCVHFIGGPEDGGQAIVPFADRDLHRATLTLEGADYEVGSVNRTCYRAELAPAPSEDVER